MLFPGRHACYVKVDSWKPKSQSTIGRQGSKLSQSEAGPSQTTTRSPISGLTRDSFEAICGYLSAGILMVIRIKSTKKKQDVDPELIVGWPSVYDAGSTSNQHWDVDPMLILGWPTVYNTCSNLKSSPGQRLVFPVKSTHQSVW